MARFDDEVGEDFVEGADGGGEGGFVAVGVEEVGEVGGVEDLAFAPEAGAGFRHGAGFSVACYC